MRANLGQNFLNKESVAADIAATIRDMDIDLVLEIGPGKAALTQKLLDVGKRVVAIEKDPALFEYLAKRYKGNENLLLVLGDIRTADWSFLDLVDRYAVVANIPYYLTSHLIRRLLEYHKKPEKIVLLIQKEVAERIVDTKHNSILSFAVSFFADAKILFSVPKSYFTPAPKVDSAVIEIVPHDKAYVNEEKQKDFFDFLKKCFHAPRQKLSNNIARIVDIKKEEIYAILNTIGIADGARAQDLSLSQMVALYEKITNTKK